MGKELTIMGSMPCRVELAVRELRDTSYVILWALSAFLFLAYYVPSILYKQDRRLEGRLLRSNRLRKAIWLCPLLLTKPRLVGKLQNALVSISKDIPSTKWNSTYRGGSTQ